MMRVALLLCTLLVAIPAHAETFRDEFNTAVFSANDGTQTWAGNWIEVDGAGAGPTVGNVLTTGGVLTLDDRPNTGGQPSLARQADLIGFSTATLTFSYRTGSGVDSSDRFRVEISANGGGSWTTLEDFTGFSGATGGSRSYNVASSISSSTRIRFRVVSGYGGSNEQFFVDDVQIEALCAQSYRDEFNAATFSGNDGALSWAGNWIEVDGAGAGPTTGNVRTTGGALTLDDRPNTGGQPSLARGADLSGATAATLTFSFSTGSGVDSSDSVVLEISSNGGGSWSPLENFTGITGSSSGTRSYDVTGFASATTRIRFRVANLYGGTNEVFSVDDVDLAVAGACSGHFAISHDGLANTCDAEPIRIGVHDATHAVDPAYTGTITLSTSNSSGDWALLAGFGTLVNAGSGGATYAYDPNDAGVVGLSLSSSTGGTLNIDVTDGTLVESSGEDADLLFAPTGAQTVRDDFSSAAFGNNDGSVNWNGGWVEFDVAGAGPATGNVLITGGELSFDDFTNTDTEPSLEREVDLSAATTATFTFDFRLSNGTDANDAIFVDVSANGGATWTRLERITGITGPTTGSRSYDLTPFRAANTRIRFSVDGLSGTGGTSCCYGASGEFFLLDFVEISFLNPGTCGPDHFDLTHDGAGVHCLAETVGVTAVDSSGAPDTGYDQQITLDAQSGRGTWALVTGNGAFSDATSDDGLATYTYVVADAGVATFSLFYTQGAASIDVDAFETATPATRDDDAEGLLVWASSGFTFTANPLANPPPNPIVDPIPDTFAGTDVAVYVTAFGTTATDPQCGVIESYTGAKSLDMWVSYDNPTTGAGVVPTIDTTPIGASEPAAVAIPFTFVSGQARVVAKYKDVGRIRIQAKDTSVTEPVGGVRGATNPFVSRPADYVVTGVVRPDQTPNPATIIPTGPVFVAAGDPFGVTVEVHDAEGDRTPNYGNETAAEGILLTSSTLVAPAGGRNGSLDDGAIGNGTLFGTTLGDGSPAAPGEFYGGTFSWDEVGAMRLTPSVGDGDYLGAGDTTGTESGDVGRFTPQRLDVVPNAPVFATACGAGNFTYLGQPFDYAPGSTPRLTVTALAAAGTTTQNYTGTWNRLTNTSLTPRTYADLAGLLDPNGAPSAATDPAIVDNSDGTLTLNYSSGTGLRFQRAALTPPLLAEIELSTNVIDLDTIAYASNPVRFGQAAAGLGIPFDSGKSVRFGRLVLGNAHDSELVAVSVPLVAQQFNGTSFVVHAADVCTSIQAGDLILAPTPPALPSAPAIGNDPLAAGDAGLVMSAPGAGNPGTVDLELQLAPGLGVDAPWLRYDWPYSGPPDASFDDNPRGRVTFGIFAGDDPVIYQREVY